MTYASLATAQRVRATALDQLPVALLGLSVAPILAANGGYYPLSWGWGAVVLAWGAALVALVRAPARPSGGELVFLGLLAAFAGWIAVSMIWTVSQTQTALELERALVYVAGVLAALSVVRRDQFAGLTGAVCAGMTAIAAYALGTRLFPHATNFTAFGGYRLSRPVGYWNGLGLMAGMATVLAFGFVGSARSAWARAAAAAAVPVTVSTLYFTFSRGAAISFAFGLLVLVGVERHRLKLLLRAAPVAAITAALVAQATRETALTHSTTSLVSAQHQGRGFAVLVLGAAAAAAYSTYLIRLLERMVPATRAVVGAGRLLVLVVVVLGVALLVAAYGSPVTMATRAYHSFTGPPTGGANLNNRLLTLSNNGRIPAWHVAWHTFEAHPLGGVGAGGFETYWDRHRTIDLKIRDAHNLYVETLAEGGVVGFALLLGVVLTPFVLFWRVRRRPLAAGALASFATYALAAAADWDWELSGVTLAALLCGTAVLIAGRRRDSETGSGRWRLVAVACAAAVALLAMFGLIGNLALNASTNAARTGDWPRAAHDAKRARTFAPWSSEPLASLGLAQVGLGQRTQAADTFRAAIRKDPQNYLLWLDLARVTSGSTRAAALAIAVKLNGRDSAVQQTVALLEAKP